MNKPIDALLLQPAEAFADYLKNTASRIDESAEAIAQSNGARVGVSRPHESAHLHVAGEATYIDDIPELAGTLHCALGLSPVANGVLKNMKLTNEQQEQVAKAIAGDKVDPEKAGQDWVKANETTVDSWLE